MLKSAASCGVPCRSPSLPDQYLPQFKESVKKAGLKWEDFKVTDNSCSPHPEPKGLLAKVGNMAWRWPGVAAAAPTADL